MGFALVRGNHSNCHASRGDNLLFDNSQIHRRVSIWLDVVIDGGELDRVREVSSNLRKKDSRFKIQTQDSRC